MSQEQMDALQEKIKNMSPEELKEFQKKQCIFCQIVAGKIQTKKIYEDDKCIAVLDINPASQGHMLLMPREHYTIMPQLPEDELVHIFMVAKSLSNSALRGLDVRGTNIIVANGPAAGQKAQHFMVHIIPRRDKDGIEFVLPQRKISENDIKTISEKLSAKMMEMLGEGRARKEEVKPEAKEAPKKKEAKAEELLDSKNPNGLETKEKKIFSESQKSSISEKLETFQNKEKTPEKKEQLKETDNGEEAEKKGNSRKEKNIKKENKEKIRKERNKTRNRNRPG